MKKTLYVKDTDMELWDRAQAELGDSISSIFADCLRERLAKKPPVGMMDKITLAFWNDNEEPVIKKSFVGRWLVGDDTTGIRADGDWDAGAEWSVAQTKERRIVVYRRHRNDGFAPAMEIYDQLEDMKEALTSDGYQFYPENVIAEAAAKLGEPYEIELDI